jgi:hypothetical protein
VNIRKALQTEVEAFQRMGHRRWTAEFLLRNGVTFYGVKRPKGMRRGTPKMCYSNSTKLFLSEHNMAYYEGFAMDPEMGLPISHAWNVRGGFQVIDLTLKEPEKYQYIGYCFPEDVLTAELVKNKVYGLLNVNEMYNVDLLRRLDPELFEGQP